MRLWKWWKSSSGWKPTTTCDGKKEKDPHLLSYLQLCKNIIRWLTIILKDKIANRFSKVFLATFSVAVMFDVIKVIVIFYNSGDIHILWLQSDILNQATKVMFEIYSMQNVKDVVNIMIDAALICKYIMRYYFLTYT